MKQAKAQGTNFIVDNICYSIIKGQGDRVKVVRRKGFRYTGVVQIPDSIVYEGKKYSVTAIGFKAFANSKIKTLIFPDNIESIGESAFSGCRSLVNLWNKKTLVHYSGGMTQEALDITFPSALTRIGNHIFANCTSLKKRKIELPSGIKVIGINTLDNIDAIYCKAIVPPAANVIEDDPFSFPCLPIRIYVPEESIGSYKKASGWNSFHSILPYSENAFLRDDENANNLLIGKWTLEYSSNSVSDPWDEGTWCEWNGFDFTEIVFDNDHTCIDVHGTTATWEVNDHTGTDDEEQRTTLTISKESKSITFILLLPKNYPRMSIKWRDNSESSNPDLMDLTDFCYVKMR